MYADVARLISLAYSVQSEVTEEIAIDSFLNGLEDSNMELRIRDKMPTSLDEAYRYALIMESYNKKHLLEDNRTANDRRLRFVHRNESIELEMNRTGRQTNDASNISMNRAECYRRGDDTCQKTRYNDTVDTRQWRSRFGRANNGSISNRSQLRLYSAPTKLSVNTSDRVNNKYQRREDCHSRCDHEYKFDDMINRNYTINNSPNERNTNHLNYRNIRMNRATDDNEPAYLNAQIGNRRFNFLLDTGCEQTTLPAYCVNRRWIKPFNGTVKAVNGSIIPIIGEADVTIKFGKFKLNITALISERCLRAIDRN